MVFESAHGVNAYKGALLFAKKAPCLIRTAIRATMTAKNRLENTQKAALGNFPSGTKGVGVNSVVMISSINRNRPQLDHLIPPGGSAYLACIPRSNMRLGVQ